MKNVVFVGGVHGVGKTYFCEPLASSLDMAHVTASGLIGWYDRHTDNKAVRNVEHNQLFLSEKLAEFKTDCHTILLDGHFCLFNKKQEIEDVPIFTFESVNLIALIMLVDEPSRIVEHLSKKSVKPQFDEESIASLQLREIERSNFVSQSLEVPIKTVHSLTDFNKSLKDVSAWLQQKGVIRARSS